MYSSVEFYMETYYGTTASGEEITKWLTRASDDLDAVTMGRAAKFDTYSPTVQELIQKATCAQAEHYIQDGDGEGAGGSMTIGSFSFSNGGGGDAAGGVCRRAMRYLSQTGLLNRAVGVCECRYRADC